MPSEGTRIEAFEPTYGYAVLPPATATDVNVDVDDQRERRTTSS